MKIAVIGKSGQLAQEILKLKLVHEIKAFGRDKIDLISPKNITQVLDDYAPTAIINASAYTAVDKAETDKENAHLLNQTAVENLANYCKKQQIKLVHVSTDYVFAGDKGAPYLPGDKRQPHGVYGNSKALGEVAIEGIVADTACIIRTSWVYSSCGNNFVKTMLRLMSEKSELGIIDDQIGSPTWAKGLAEACVYAAEKDVIGIHHWSDLGVASWYDFAVAIQELAIAKRLLSQPILLRPIPTSAYPTPAKRPSYSVLDKASLFTDFADLQKHHWRYQLEQMLEQLK